MAPPVWPLAVTGLRVSLLYGEGPHMPCWAVWAPCPHCRGAPRGPSPSLWLQNQTRTLVWGPARPGLTGGAVSAVWCTSAPPSQPHLVLPGRAAPALGWLPPGSSRSLGSLYVRSSRLGFCGQRSPSRTTGAPAVSCALGTVRSTLRGCVQPVCGGWTETPRTEATRAPVAVART